MALIHSIDRWGIDGIALVIALRIIGTPAKRSSFDFTSLADKVFVRLESSKTTCSIIGATDSENSRFIEVIRGRYPDLNIVYSRCGYFQTQASYAETLETLAKIDPGFVLCGMGAVAQETFFRDLRSRGWQGAGSTCGGFIRQTATGRINYYPPLIDKLNIRFLYRIFDEPKLLRRYCIYYPLFVPLFFSDVFRASIYSLIGRIRSRV